MRITHRSRERVPQITMSLKTRHAVRQCRSARTNTAILLLQMCRSLAKKIEF